MKHDLITADQSPVRAKVPGYSPAEARGIEDYWIKHMPGAGQSGGGKRPYEMTYGGRPPSNAKARVLEALKKHGPCKAADLTLQIYGMHRSSVNYALSGLRGDGLAVSIGGGSHVKWEAVE